MRANVKAFPFKSINMMMRPAFHVLSEHKYSVPKLLGSSTTGYGAIYQKFITFIRTWKGSELARAPQQQHLQSPQRLQRAASSSIQRVPRLYMVTIDIRRCFDNINREVLLQLVEGVLREDAYTLEAYNQAKLQMGNVYVRHRQLVYPAHKVDDFPAGMRHKAQKHKNLVFCDKVWRRHFTRDELLQHFREHIMSNITRLDGKYYLQTKGVPQGSVLSSLLTCIFLGHVEKKFLKPKLKQSLKRSSSNFNHQFKRSDHTKMMLRHVDDFIFISTHKASVDSFIQTMSKGMPELGVQVNVKKTKTNYDARVDGVKLYNVREELGVEGQGKTLGLLPWNGLLICPETLQVPSEWGVCAYVCVCARECISCVNPTLPIIHFPLLRSTPTSRASGTLA
jgi:telomerase reverse transcriptase